MAIRYGLFWLQPSASASRPHKVGFVTPRNDDDPLWQVWNDDTGTDVIHDVYPNKTVIKGHVHPHATNTYTLGSTSLRYSTIYGVAGNFSGGVTSTLTGAGFQSGLILQNLQAAAADVGPALEYQGIGPVSMGALRYGWAGAATTASYWSVTTRESDAVAERLKYSAGVFAVTGGLTVSTTATITGAVTLSSTLGVTGASTLTGDVITSVIRRGTSDGSDNSLLTLSGGGGTTTARGATVVLYGNEEGAGAGALVLAAGVGSGAASIVFQTGATTTTRGRFDASGVLILGSGTAAGSAAAGGIRAVGASQFDATVYVADITATTANLVLSSVSTGFVDIVTGGTSTLRARADGTVLINDTSNANMTLGLTINQGAADNEILAFKSSDVAHGMTGVTETDTYARFNKATAASGGFQLVGLTGATIGLQLGGAQTTTNTTKSTAGVGAVVIDAYLKSGTSIGAVSADGNLLTVTNNGTTRFILDAEGSFHADVESTTFDAHNDLVLLEDMESLLAPGQVQRRFGQSLVYDRAFFEREGLIHDMREVGPGRVRAMVNTTRMMMLYSGAIRQVGGMAQDAHSRVDRLEAAMLSLPGGREALAALEN